MTTLLVVSILLRVVVAFFYGDQVPPPVNAPDETSYSYLADRLAAGYGYSFDRPWYPFGQPAGTPTAHWSFLYTAFLAGVYSLFGVHPLVARIISAVLGGCLLPWMVYRLTLTLFPGRYKLALLSLACSAFYGYFILFASRLMTETFFIIALLWILRQSIILKRSTNVRNAALLGVGLGITTLLRQSVLPCVVVVFLWLLWSAWLGQQVGAMAKALAVSTVLLMVLILPFTIRNFNVYGRFLLLNSNAGYAMYSAQHPMHGTSFQEHTAAPIPADLAVNELNEAELDQILMRRGIEYVLDDPIRFSLLSLSRVADYFEFWPTGESSLLYNVGRVLSFGLYLPFMAWGGGILIKRIGPLDSRNHWMKSSTEPLMMLFLVLIAYSGLHILTWAMPRYRLPVDAVAMIFVAVALDTYVVPFLTKGSLSNTG
jgi:hypothetical protein